MPLHPDFPVDPYAVLDPSIRWYPGDAMLAEMGYEMLLPPLVHKVRQGVKTWRDGGYEGASPTTRALLNHWFRSEHLLPEADGTVRPFQWYFAQREAVESAIWLYEIERSRDPYALMKHDSSGRVSKGMFPEDWPRYVMKMATGAGKTKVIGLVIAWCYFHKRYEPDSAISTNFLLLAPNIIVLDRLLVDFDGLKIFYDDPILPANGYEGQNWHDDFQVTLHVQDQIGHVSDTGNIFLSNIHRVYEGDNPPSLDDEDTSSYFLGPWPAGKTTDSQVDLGVIVREVPDLVVLNDEAHHIHDPRMAWFKNIEDIALRLRQKGSDLSAQFDLTATPKHDGGAIFVQTISDYPLVEGIRQGVVKTPVLPDPASRAKLQERKSAKFTEQYGDYLHLGYLEWKKVYDELLPTGKKSVLFVMTDDTRNCDEVAAHLESRYPELANAVLVIHTKNNGEISEASSGKSKGELDRLRKLSRTIDDPDNPYKAIVSVMVLREGWDVQNVVAIGITCQKPLHRALERDEALVQQWLKQDYPRIRALAQREKAAIYFGDAAHMRSDHHSGRSWGKKGETPIVSSTGARYRMSLISAVTSRGHMRFMIKEKGGVNAEVFIEFLRRLMVGTKNKIFLIVDRGPAHVAKKTKAFVAGLGGKLRLFYLPPYSPDRNPDELVWKHLKADTVGRTSITSLADFRTKVKSSMLSLQRNSGKIRSFFQKPSLKYAA